MFLESILVHSRSHYVGVIHHDPIKLPPLMSITFAVNDKDGIASASLVILYVRPLVFIHL